MVHPKLHIRWGFGAGLALPSSPQPGHLAFPQAGLGTMSVASLLLRGMHMAPSWGASLDGSQSLARAHKSLGQAISLSCLPSPASALLLLLYFIFPSPQDVFLASVPLLYCVQTSCPERWDGALHQSCEHEHVWFKIAPVSRKRALPARPTAAPDNETS